MRIKRTGAPWTTRYSSKNTLVIQTNRHAVGSGWHEDILQIKRVARTKILVCDYQLIRQILRIECILPARLLILENKSQINQAICILRNALLIVRSEVHLILKAIFSSQTSRSPFTNVHCVSHTKIGSPLRRTSQAVA